MSSGAGVHLITGIQAAGKSTVAQALAERLPAPSVHLHGDQFRRWIVRGRVDMAADLPPDEGAAALDQLRLRYRLAADASDLYAASGFSVVVQDVVLGPELLFFVGAVRTRPLRVVVLAPRAHVVAERERGRGKDAYRRWTVDLLDRGLRRDTPRIGLWVDTSALTAEQTVEEILRRSAEAVVRS